MDWFSNVLVTTAIHTESFYINIKYIASLSGSEDGITKGKVPQLGDQWCFNVLKVT